MHIPDKIISGGQTGADLGGLVGAKRVGIPTGGTAPRGFKTEVGNKPEELKAFGLVSHPSPDYRFRTEENVKNSDATIIMAVDASSTGTQLTISLCKKHCKPYLVANPWDDCVEHLQAFLEAERPKVINIAGNRESKARGLTAQTARLVQQVFCG
jgi:hypothetical protein